MERSDVLKRDNEVRVSIMGPDGSKLYETSGSGYHTLDDAIREAIAKADLQANPEDCSFDVTNLTTGVSHSYRLNAHGNLKLIV